MPDYTVKSLAEEMSVTEEFVYSLVRRGKLPAYRAGRVIRIPAAEVEAYKAKRAIVPTSPAPAGRRHSTVKKRKGLRPGEVVYVPGMKLV